MSEEDPSILSLPTLEEEDTNQELEDLPIELELKVKQDKSDARAGLSRASSGSSIGSHTVLINKAGRHDGGSQRPQSPPSPRPNLSHSTREDSQVVLQRADGGTMPELTRMKASRKLRKELLSRRRSYVNNIELSPLSHAQPQQKDSKPYIRRSTSSTWSLAVDLGGMTSTWVFPHSHPYRLAWDRVIDVCMLYLLLVIPLQLAFETSSSLLFAIDIIITLIFVANIFVNFRTTIQTPTALISQPKEIKEYYVKSRWIIIDIIAAIPWDMVFQPAMGSSSSALLATRLIRMVKFVQFWRERKFSLHINQGTLMLLRNVTNAFVLAHWLGCVWYLISELEHFEPGGILVPVSLVDESVSYRYYRALHWGLWSLISLGSELQQPDSSLQTTLAITVIVAGVYVFATIIGNIEVLLAQKYSREMEFTEAVNALREFFRLKKLPSELKEHILVHIEQYWRRHHGIKVDKLLSVLPEETRNSVYRCLYMDEIHACTFFSACSTAFLEMLSLKIQQEIALKGDWVIRQGSIGKEMYIIHKGQAEAVNKDTGEVYTLMKEGAFFGEIALITNCRRTASVVAKTFMELFKISKSDFEELLQSFPEEKPRFYKVADRRKSKASLLKSKIAASTDHTWNRGDVERLYENHQEMSELFGSMRTFFNRFDTDGDETIDKAEQERILRFLDKEQRRLAKLKAESQDDDLDGSTPERSATPKLKASDSMRSLSAISESDDGKAMDH